MTHFYLAQFFNRPEFVIPWANYATAYQMTLDGNLSGVERTMWENRVSAAKQQLYDSHSHALVDALACL